jgi:hypothetical protein
MSDRTTPSIKTSAAAIAAVFIALSSGSAHAQAIRCEALVFPEERIACYNYRAALAGGPSCLLCAPQPQSPAKRVKKRRGSR